MLAYGAWRGLTARQAMGGRAGAVVANDSGDELDRQQMMMTMPANGKWCLLAVEASKQQGCCCCLAVLAWRRWLADDGATLAGAVGKAK